MKIGLMGAWNTDSGAAIHSEFVGRGWVELGHSLKVFTFFKESFHGTAIVGDDENYVTRCFTVSTALPPFLDPVPFLTSDYEIFVVEDLGMFPKDLLGKIFHWIKRKAKTVNIIHDGKLAPDPAFYQFEWDSIVCFDHRYKSFLKTAYPEDKIHIIPYPCYPWKVGDKKKSRERLNLPLHKKIIFLFGPASEKGTSKFPVLKSLFKDYPVHILVVTKHPGSLKEWRKIKNQSPFIEIREDAPDLDELYTYLHAADLLLYNKPSLPTVAVASTAFQVLGSGCPMVALESNFVEKFGGAVMKYDSDVKLKENLSSVFEQDVKYKKTIREQEKFVKKNSGLDVAKKHIELFKQLKKV